jgi:hypothetical protein
VFKEDAGKKVRASLGIEVPSRLTAGAMSLTLVAGWALARPAKRSGSEKWDVLGI